MAEESHHKSVKVGLKAGGGRPPGYSWGVLILDRAHDEARGFLSDDQYHHMSCQVRELASQDDPTHCTTVDVRPIEDFYEIRDKGGVLGKLNVRVFFLVDKGTRNLVILGAINKQNDGHTPNGDRVRMRVRARRYRGGSNLGSDQSMSDSPEAD